MPNDVVLSKAGKKVCVVYAPQFQVCFRERRGQADTRGAGNAVPDSDGGGTASTAIRAGHQTAFRGGHGDEITLHPGSSRAPHTPTGSGMYVPHHNFTIGAVHLAVIQYVWMLVGQKVQGVFVTEFFSLALNN